MVVLGSFMAAFPHVAVAADRPVVVELFTSQGCSSCPPANVYLNELSKKGPEVLALAFHVTYWDYLGWKDPFSLQAATDRQARYGRRFGDGSYTPEIVVDGGTGLVGSHREGVEAAIANARAKNTTAADVRIAVREGKGLDRRRSGDRALRKFISSGMTASTSLPSAGAKIEGGRCPSRTLFDRSGQLEIGKEPQSISISRFRKERKSL